MQLEVRIIRNLVCALCCFVMTACTYNPFIRNNNLTGDPTTTAFGAGAGAGSVWLLGGSKTMMLFGGIAGGAAGYYLTSLRYDAGGIIDAGGDVYVLGDYLGIYIPTDKLFEVNTADLLPTAPRILNSVVSVLQRKPENNIMISGNTSGFDRPRREQKLSQKRAKVVAAYLWTSGVEQFKYGSRGKRKLNYTGYGDFFPIASDLTNKGIRTNSRIQITSYPTKSCLKLKNDESAKIETESCGQKGC